MKQTFGVTDWLPAAQEIEWIRMPGWAEIDFGRIAEVRADHANGILIFYTSEHIRCK